jgi:hypothetical protein
MDSVGANTEISAAPAPSGDVRVPRTVERVARAISRRFIETNKAAGHPTNLTWRDYVPDAIAAIEAMREPSVSQLAAGQEAWLKDDLRRSSTLYRAMIEAALA